jgi:hypothetical protein
MHLEAILTQLHKNASNLFVCGDINVNYLQDSRNKSLLNSSLTSFNLHSAVNFPTRISNCSSTTIDNIFLDKNKNKDYSIIPISNGLSNHDAQIIQLHDVDIPTQQIKPCNKSEINEATIAQFKINLSYESWHVFNDEDPDSSYNNFLNTYLRIYYNSFPTQKVHIHNNNKAWLTKGIRNSCQKKQNLYLIYKHTDNLKLRNYYKTYCKILSEVIKTAKNLHFNHILRHSSNKTKTMWNLVKSEINKQETSDNFPPYMEGELVKDHHDLANRFNEYFNNVTTNTYADITTGNFPAINNFYSAYRQSFPQI